MGGLVAAGIFLTLVLLGSIIIGLACLYTRKNRQKEKWPQFSPTTLNYSHGPPLSDQFRSYSQEHLLHDKSRRGTITIELSPEGCTGGSQNFKTQDRRPSRTSKNHRAPSTPSSVHYAYDEFDTPSKIYLHRLLQTGTRQLKLPRRLIEKVGNTRKHSKGSVSRSLGDDDDLEMALLHDHRRKHKDFKPDTMCHGDDTHVPFRNDYQTYRESLLTCDTDMGRISNSDDMLVRAGGSRSTKPSLAKQLSSKNSFPCFVTGDLSTESLNSSLRSSSLTLQAMKLGSQNEIRQSDSKTRQHYMNSIGNKNVNTFGKSTSKTRQQSVKDNVETTKANGASESSSVTRHLSVKDMVAGFNESMNTGTTSKTPSPWKMVRNVGDGRTHVNGEGFLANKKDKRMSKFKTRRKTSREGQGGLSALITSNSSSMYTSTDEDADETMNVPKETRSTKSSFPGRETVGDRRNKITSQNDVSPMKSIDTDVRTYPEVTKALNSSSPSMYGKQIGDDNKESRISNSNVRHLSKTDDNGPSNAGTNTSKRSCSSSMADVVNDTYEDQNEIKVSTSTTNALQTPKKGVMERVTNFQRGGTQYEPPLKNITMNKETDANRAHTKDVTKSNSTTRHMSVKEMVAELNSSKNDDIKYNSSPTKKLFDSPSPKKLYNSSPPKKIHDEVVNEISVHQEETRTSFSSTSDKTVKEMVDEIKSESKHVKRSNLTIRQDFLSEISEDSNDEVSEIKMLDVPLKFNAAIETITEKGDQTEIKTQQTPVQAMSVEDMVSQADEHAHQPSVYQSPTRFIATSNTEMRFQNWSPDRKANLEVTQSESNIVHKKSPNVLIDKEHVRPNMVMRNINRSSKLVDPNFKVVQETEKIASHTKAFVETKDSPPSAKSRESSRLLTRPTISYPKNIPNDDIDKNELKTDSANVVHKQSNNTSPDKHIYNKHVEKTLNKVHQVDTTHVSPVFNKYSSPLRETSGRNSGLRENTFEPCKERHSPNKRSPSDQRRKSFTASYNDGAQNVPCSKDRSPKAPPTTTKSSIDSVTPIRASLPPISVPQSSNSVEHKRQIKTTPPKVQPRPSPPNKRFGSTCNQTKTFSPPQHKMSAQPTADIPTSLNYNVGGVDRIPHPPDSPALRSPNKQTSPRRVTLIPISNTHLKRGSRPNNAIQKRENGEEDSMECSSQAENAGVSIPKSLKRVSFRQQLAKTDGDEKDISDWDDKSSNNVDVSIIQSTKHVDFRDYVQDGSILKSPLPDEIPVAAPPVSLLQSSPEKYTPLHMIHSEAHSSSQNEKPQHALSTFSKVPVYTNTRWSLKPYNTIPTIVSSYDSVSNMDTSIASNKTASIPPSPPDPPLPPPTINKFKPLFINSIFPNHTSMSEHPPQSSVQDSFISFSAESCIVDVEIKPSGCTEGFTNGVTDNILHGDYALTENGQVQTGVMKETNETNTGEIHDRHGLNTDYNIVVDESRSDIVNDQGGYTTYDIDEYTSDYSFGEMDLGTKIDYGRKISLDTVIAEIVHRRRAERLQNESNNNTSDNECVFDDDVDADSEDADDESEI